MLERSAKFKFSFRSIGRICCTRKTGSEFVSCIPWCIQGCRVRWLDCIRWQSSRGCSFSLTRLNELAAAISSERWARVRKIVRNASEWMNRRPQSKTVGETFSSLSAVCFSSFVRNGWERDNCTKVDREQKYVVVVQSARWDGCVWIYMRRKYIYIFFKSKKVKLSINS